MTKVLDRENPSILINACCPGYCATSMSSFAGYGDKESADKAGHRSAEMGARTPAFLALECSESGGFYADLALTEW